MFPPWINDIALAASTIEEQQERKGSAIGFDGLIRKLKLTLPHGEVIRNALRELASDSNQLKNNGLTFPSFFKCDKQAFGGKSYPACSLS